MMNKRLDHILYVIAFCGAGINITALFIEEYVFILLGLPLICVGVFGHMLIVNRDKSSDTVVDV